MMMAVGCDQSGTAGSSSTTKATPANATRYLPLPLNVGKEDLRTDIYLAAKVSETPVALEAAVRESRFPDVGVVDQIVKALRAKDATSYGKASWSPERAEKEVAFLTRHIDLSKADTIVRRFEVGELRYYAIGLPNGQTFPVILRAKEGETRGSMDVMMHDIPQVLSA